MEENVELGSLRASSFNAARRVRNESNSLFCVSRRALKFEVAISVNVVDGKSHGTDERVVNRSCQTFN